MTAPDRKQQFIDQHVELYRSSGDSVCEWYIFKFTERVLRLAFALAYDMGALHEREKKEEGNGE